MDNPKAGRTRASTGARGEAGYTLIEVMAATAVIALVGMAAVGLVLTSMEGYQVTSVQSDATHYVGYLSRSLSRDAAVVDPADPDGIALDPDNPDRVTLRGRTPDGTRRSVQYRLTPAGEVVRHPNAPPGPDRIVARGLDPDEGVRFALSPDGSRLQIHLAFQGGADRWETDVEFCLLECLP